MVHVYDYMRMRAQMCPLYNGVWRSPKHDVAVEFGCSQKGGLLTLMLNPSMN